MRPILDVDNQGRQGFDVVIPARYASTRFPGKALAELAGKPMVVHVCERAVSSGARSVHVATDDERIAQAVRAHGHQAVMTRIEHVSGTDRIAEAARKLALPEDGIVVNVQGDEPLIPPTLISGVAAALAHNRGASMATACHPIADLASVFNPNVVKVVLNAAGEALYFSRAPIPWSRDGYPGDSYAGDSRRAAPRRLPPGVSCLRHVGIYAYRAGFLRRYASLSPAPLELAESLEQLRVLWHGFRIAVAISDTDTPPGVDTPQDLEAVRTIIGETRAPAGPGIRRP